MSLSLVAVLTRVALHSIVTSGDIHQSDITCHCLRIRAFLCDRPQRICVRVDALSVRTGGGSLSSCTVLPDGSVMSKECVLNAGAPRVCLVPLLFSVYTNVHK